MLGRTSNQPGWLERCNLLVLSCLGNLTDNDSVPVGALDVLVVHATVPYPVSEIKPLWQGVRSIAIQNRSEFQYDAQSLVESLLAGIC